MQKKLTRFILLMIVLSNILVGLGIFIVSHLYTRSLISTILHDTHNQIESRLREFDVLFKEVEHALDAGVEKRLPALVEELMDLDIPLANLEVDQMNRILEKYQFDDLYLVNEQGIVFNTTYEPDQYFRLFTISPDFREFLEALFGGGIVKTERISLSARTGKIRKFSYYSPSGSDILFEVSINVRNYVERNYSSDFSEYLSGRIFTDITDNNNYLEEVNIYSVTEIGQWSLINEGQRMDPEIFMLSNTNEAFTLQRNGFEEEYRPIHFRVSESFISYYQLWLKTVYDFSSIMAHRRMVIIVSLVITLLSIVLTYFLVSGHINKHIVSRITGINRALNHIANGSRDEKLQCSEKDELAKISRNILFMQGQIREKERTIIEINDALEEKVEHRTTALSDEIVNHMKTEDLLRDAILTSESANRSKSEFLTNVSHELQTPLNAVIGFTEILLDDEDRADRKQKLALINDAAIQLMNIVNNILDYSRIESHSLQIENHVMNLPHTLRMTFGLLQEQARLKGLEYDIELHRNIPEIAYGDSGRIRQIIWNLLSNAIKFTPKGRVDMICDYIDEWLIVKVIDSGIGIGEVDRDKIFKAFEQVSKSTTRRYSGTGLGLAISQRLAEIMFGSITFESVMGSGSVFTFKVQVKPPNKLTDDTK